MSEIFSLKNPPSASPSLLAPYATIAAETRGRKFAENASRTRSAFQRDRDRIIHSGSFRKLKGKTQVFMDGQGDYYRTRLTHSLEVAQIARTMARCLAADEDLTEGLALAHDLGHTCFGHTGEDALNEVMQPYGGFDHNDQTFRVLTEVEHRYAAYRGLNLTWEMLEGVVKHNGPLRPEKPRKPVPPGIKAFDAEWSLELHTQAGLEAQLAAIADDIAYNSHDIDDGYRSGLFGLGDVAELPFFGREMAQVKRQWPDLSPALLVSETVRNVIGIWVDDVLSQTQSKLAQYQPRSAIELRALPEAVVHFSAKVNAEIKTIREFLFPKLYRHPRLAVLREQAAQVVRELFIQFMAAPQHLPEAWSSYARSLPDLQRARFIADYIAGMTDRYALQEYQRLTGKKIELGL